MKRIGILLIFFLAFILISSGCSKSTDVNNPMENITDVPEDHQNENKEIQTDNEVIPTKAIAKEETIKEDKITEEFVLKEGTIETIDYDSKAISENLLNEKTVQQLYVYLPPSYEESDKKYPVVYFLHGFGESALSFARYAKVSFDPEFSKNPGKEFILVAIDGSNSAGGSYYVNSPVIGNWEDYTVKEVVSYIDSNYRTLAKAESRGICGFSMGGYGALHLAFLYPDVYSCVYSMSPGVLAPGKIGDALDTWKYDRQFLRAYSLAFAYNEEEPYETLPVRDGSEADNSLLERWESGFGHWEEKVDAYLLLDSKLKAIGLSCGSYDTYGWITEGTIYLSDFLKQKGINNLLVNFDGGHVMPPNTMKDHLLPFFKEALVWE
ncbi:MAG: alpha/beta fold hydrolase [Mobilitalea sp.]